VTQFTAEEDRYNYSRETLMARIAVGLGGRVAEERTFGPQGVTTGAENDLRVVTDLAHRMVTRWGMSEQVGVMYAESRNEASGVGLNMRRLESEDMPGKARALISDADGHLIIDGNDQRARQLACAMMVPGANRVSSATLAAAVNSEVQRILREGYEMARHIIHEHCDQLIALADALLAHEQLDRKQFEGLLQK
jgi:cell division protease FtsH